MEDKSTVWIIIAVGIDSRFQGQYAKTIFMKENDLVFHRSVRHAISLDDFVVLDEAEFSNRRIECEYGVKPVVSEKSRNTC